jgi:ribosomal protein L11 methyltransferase
VAPLRTRRRGAVAAPAPGPPWVEVSVTVSAQAAEAAAAVLYDLRIGGLIEDRSARSLVRFRCYLPRSRLLSTTLEGVRRRLAELRRYGLDPGRIRLSQRRLAPRSWATAWRSHVRPVTVGRVLIRPSWISSPPPARGVVEIRIDPGMAFGTGMHPSTRLCLRALQRGLSGQRAFPAGGTVFDIGTGSGILAIAAARLGAGTVWAVDNDPVAVATAVGNARLNGVAGCVRVIRGTGLDGATGHAHLIVANLIADTIVTLLPHVAEHLSPGGVFVGSGIVAHNLRSVLRAARAAGFLRVRRTAEGEWRAVVLAMPRRHAKSRKRNQVNVAKRSRLVKQRATSASTPRPRR